jgi:hypothetical protein
MNTPCKVLLIALSCSLPSQAFAASDDTVQKVRELAKEAQNDTALGHYEAAVQKLTQAYGMAKVPTLARSIARVLAKQGKLVAACEYYQQALQLEPNELWRAQLQQTAQNEAAAERSELLPRLSHLRVVVEGASSEQLTLSMDNVVVPTAVVGTEQVVDPGLRHLIVSQGSQSAEQNVELKQGEHRQVVLRLGAHSSAQPLAATASSTTKDGGGGAIQPTLGWVSLGLGAAGLVVGATAGIVAEVKLSHLHDDGCRGNWCPTRYSGRVDSYNGLLKVSTVGFVVAGIGAAAGITLLLTSPHRESKPEVSLSILPSSVALQGGF